VGQVGLDAAFEQFNFFGCEQVAYAHRTIALVIGHVLVCGAGLHALVEGGYGWGGHVVECVRLASVQGLHQKQFSA
jgi:hypothetical protein